VYDTKSQVPGDIILKDLATQTTTKVHNLEPSQACCTLGAHLSPDESSKQQMQVTITKARNQAK
jgi:hypothetical protein